MSVKGSSQMENLVRFRLLPDVAKKQVIPVPMQCQRLHVDYDYLLLCFKVLQNLFADVLELKSHLHILKTKVSIRNRPEHLCKTTK